MIWDYRVQGLGFRTGQNWFKGLLTGLEKSYLGFRAGIKI